MAGSEFGATTTCGSQGTSSAGLRGCFTSATWAGSRRVAIPAGPAVPELPVVKGSWVTTRSLKDHYHLSEASDSLLELHWGGRGSRWRRHADFPAWMEFKFIPLQGCIRSWDDFPFSVCSDFFRVRGCCLLTYGCGVSQTEISLWDKLLPFLDRWFVHRQ